MGSQSGGKKASVNSNTEQNSLLEFIPYGIIEIDLGWNVLYANRHVLGLFDYDLCDIIGVSFKDLLVKSGNSVLLELIKNYIFKENRPCSWYSDFISYEGETFNIRIDWNYRLNENEEVCSYVVSFNEISRNVEGNNPLRAGENKYRLLFANMLSGFALYDVVTDNRNQLIEYRLREINKAVAHQTGLDKNRDIRNPFNSILLQNPLLKHKVYEKVCKQKLSFHIEYTEELLAKELQLHAYSPQKGQVAVLFTDITEHKKAEEKFIQSREKFHIIFESSPKAILLTDLKGNIIDCNKATIGFLGLNSKEELIGQNPIEMAEGDESERISKQLQEIVEQKKSGSIEFSLNLDGVHRGTVEFSVDVITDTHKKPVSLVVIIVDITKHMKYAQQTRDELSRAKKKADESEKMKSSFLANMSHEIRTPMNSIVGFSSMLSKPDLSIEKKKKYLSFINSSTEDLLNLINNILDLSKIQSGEMDLYIRECNLNNLLSELWILFNERKKIEQKEHVELKLSVPENSDDMIIITDARRLEQVLSCHLSNAIKFTDKGYVEFGYEILETEKKLKFFIIDTGIGIRKQKQKIIFESFTKLQSQEDKLYQGTGLGLTLSKSVVDMMGGEIWVESDAGKGATFFVTIPLKRARQPYAKDFTNDPMVGDEVWLSWKNKTILIVEDDFHGFLLLESLLEESGVRILYAENGKKAVELFEQNYDIDLVMMDINLPEMDGYEATRKIKQIKPNIPIIAQTAYTWAHEKSKCLEAGCDDYITKPINGNLVFNKINKQLLPRA